MLCTASLSLSSLFAVEPLPDPPLVGTAPDPSAWVINVQQKKPLQPPSDQKAAAIYQRVLQAFPRLLRVEVAKSGPNRREVTFWENKKTSSLFVHNGWVIFQPADWPADHAMAVPVNSRMSPIKGGIKSDFSDVDWIRPEAYIGKQSYSGQECYYYEDKKHAALSGGDTTVARPSGVRAWIEVKSHLPIAVEDDSVLKTFTYRQSNINVELTGVFATAYENSLKATTRNY